MAKGIWELASRFRDRVFLRARPALPNKINVMSLLVRDVLPFFAGAMIAKLVEATLDWPHKVQGRQDAQIVILTALAISILMLILILRISTLVETLRNDRAYNVFLHRDHYADGRIRKGAFSFCTAAALQATKSIIVMGPHFEHKRAPTDARPVDTPTPGTASHDLYLEEGMSAAVERHIHSDSSDFRYERIVQLAPDVFRSVREKHECSSSAFNNPVTAQHVADMLKKATQAHTAEISMTARPYIASFPSTLVIDDRYVFFSLPTGLISHEEELDGGRESYNYDIVIGFEDLTGEIPKLFRQILLQFKNGGIKLENVLFDDAAPASVQLE